MADAAYTANMLLLLMCWCADAADALTRLMMFSKWNKLVTFFIFKTLIEISLVFWISRYNQEKQQKYERTTSTFLSVERIVSTCLLVLFLLRGTWNPTPTYFQSWGERGKQSLTSHSCIKASILVLGRGLAQFKPNVYQMFCMFTNTLDLEFWPFSSMFIR